MAPKRSSHLDDPPAASSSEEEEEASSDEEEDEEASGSEDGKVKATPLSSPAPAPATEKKNPSKKADSSSGSDSDTESSSDSEPADSAVKPIASKPMEETPKAKKPRSKPAATSSRASAKRPPAESDAKDSKRAKKKGSEPDGSATPAVEDESKKGGDEKKLFQRLWSEEDEIVILKGMIDYVAKKGADPSADMNAFQDFIKKSLQFDCTKTQLSDKVRRLKKKFENNSGKKKYNPTKPHEEQVFELSKKIWGGGKSEQPKANGTARSSQKGNNSKTLASLKSELFSTSEALKDVENLEVDRNAGILGSLAGVDKSLGVLGLPEIVVKQGLDLISGPKKAELEEKWKKIQVAELELFAKRTQLLSDQAKLILEALKSADH